MTQPNIHGQLIGPVVENWTARSLPPRTPLIGRTCRVEPVDVGRHSEDLFAAYSAAPDDRDWTYLPSERPTSKAAFATYLAGMAAASDPLHYAVIESGSGKAVGTAAHMRIDPGNGAIEVGFIRWSPLMQRHVSGTEAIYLLMKRAFDELGYRRYEWKCDNLNERSRAAALRYGFRFEGVFRNAAVVKGRSRNTAWFSITDDEWPAVKTAFEEWLSPSNFDGEGRQRRTLADLRA
jgi:RimJ/RimL family protein N-acetyltransferase